MVIIKALAWVLSLAAVVESCPFPRGHETGQDSTGQE